MRSTLAVAVALGAGLATATPSPMYKYFKRQAYSTAANATTANNGTMGINDVTILNYALTLEQLEAAFYQEGLRNFTQQDFTNAGFNSTTFYPTLRNVSADENTHVTVLTDAIRAANGTPVSPCTYNFGVLNATQFVATAQLLEGVGIGAYLGVLSSISNPAYLTEAATIVTVEARHSSFFREAQGLLPNPQPFDVPLGPDLVFGLAPAFIQHCNTSTGLPNLPFVAPPPLTTVSTQGRPLAPGSTLTLRTNATMSANQTVVAFLQETGDIFVTPRNSTNGTISVTVPQGPSGETFVVLTTTTNGTISGNSVLAGPAIVQLLGPSLNSTSLNSTSTTNSTSS